MKNQEVVFKKRLQDLSRMAYFRNVPMFTDFLDLNELHIVHSFRPEESEMNIHYFGGYEGAERQIAAFFPDALSFDEDYKTLIPYPISCLCISPCSKKYGEKLSHRDYLGALIHLGIERGKLGDIVVKEDSAYVFCHEQMTEFLIQNLTKVRHTNIVIQKITNPEELPKPELKQIHGTVASIRLDSMIALAFSTSRSSMIGLIEGGKVFVNGKMVISNGHPLKEGDIVSVRGYGKFKFSGEIRATKKGRYSVTVFLYV